MFFQTLVILRVDSKVVEVISVETPVVVLDVTMGFTVVTVPFFETEETGVVDGFITRLEDLFAWLKATRGVFPIELALEFSRDSALCASRPSGSVRSMAACGSGSANLHHRPKLHHRPDTSRRSCCSERRTWRPTCPQLRWPLRW